MSYKRNYCLSLEKGHRRTGAGKMFRDNSIVIKKLINTGAKSYIITLTLNNFHIPYKR